jgi:sodium-independent sulfate anion transporter 11
MSGSKVGRGLAKAVGIDVDERFKTEPSTLLQSAASTLQSRSIDPYYETEPTVKEYLLDHRPTLAGVGRYVHSLFPFIDWIFHYNLTVSFRVPSLSP